MQLILAGYTLAYACLLITAARLGDRYGYHRLFVLGTVVFTAGSVAAARAPDAAFLIAARLVQGAGSGLVAPQVLPIAQVAVPAARRPRALGLFGAPMGVASLAGPLIGGLLVGADLFGLGWRSVFLVTVPVALVSLAGATVLPRTRGAAGQRVDGVGVLLTTVGFGALCCRSRWEGKPAGSGGHGPRRPCRWPSWAVVAHPRRPADTGQPCSRSRRRYWRGRPWLSRRSSARQPDAGQRCRSWSRRHRVRFVHRLGVRSGAGEGGRLRGRFRVRAVVLPTAQQLGGSIGVAAAGLVHFAPAAGPAAAFRHAMIYEAAVFTVTALISLRMRDRNRSAVPRADAARAAGTFGTPGS
ncbi:MFS transporter [Streptomyces glaucus]|uniref:Major facilitator superfamily (MFS) profile domain-containing protein n=1 Tax=Streptomyces glaucus TaxID=284029 RepID=A0ABN3JNS2_9ACTN